MGYEKIYIDTAFLTVEALSVRIGVLLVNMSMVVT